MMNWLSILVPVYNVEPYLAECLESVVSQAGEGVEILVLDDCSTDGSWALMQQLAARWPQRLRLMRHERNGGLSAARNTMIGAATGEYLWFLDSDDKLLPGAMGELRQIVQSQAPDVVLCDFAVWRERPRLKHRLRGELHRRSFSGPSGTLGRSRDVLLAGLLETGLLHAWSKISRRSLWDTSLRFPEGRYFEDMMAMPLMALRCASFYHCPRPWVAYRQRGDSILATMNERKALDQAGALRPLAEALGTQGHAPALRLAWALQCARNYTGAMRYLQRQAATLGEARTRALAQSLREAFEASSPMTAQQLQAACWRKGWWLRGARFRRWWNIKW